MADTDTALVLRMEASLAKFEKQMARARQVGSDSATRLEKRFANANSSMSRSAENSAQVIGREMDRLRTKYDPLYAASRRYERELDELNRAQRLGAITAKQYEAALETLNAEYHRGAGAVVAMRGGVAQVNTGLTAMQTGAVRASSGLRGMRGGIQNTSYQIADFAVQVSNGTAASVALGQQLPQLLGGFGVMGAVLGAVVAVGGPLISMLVRSGEESKTLEDRLEGLRDAVQDYRDAAADARSPTAELAERYGEASEKAREFLGALREITQVQAREEVNSTFAQLGRTYGGLDDVARGPMQMNQGWTEFTRTIEDMASALEISQEKARSLAGAFQNLSSASTPDEQVDAAESMLAALETALGPYAEMNEEARTLYENVRAAGDEAAALVGAADAGSAAISGAADQAKRMADEVQRALDGLISMAAQGVDSLRESEIRLKYKGDPVATAGALARDRMLSEQAILRDGADASEIAMLDAQVAAHVRTIEARERNRQDLAEWERAQAKAAGGSGGAKKLNETLRHAERLFDQTRTKAEEYAIALRELEEAYATTNGFEGLGGQETYDRALQKLKEEFGELPGLARDASNAVRSAFDGIFDDPARALENLAKQLAQMALYQGLASALPSVFGAGGTVPLVANAKGGVYSGAGINAYSGKVVSSPTVFPFAKGAGLMGEAGPEAIMPLTRGANGRLGVQAQGGGARQVVNVMTEPGLAVERRQRRGPSGEQLVEIKVRQTLASGRADGAMRGRYGAKPQGKKR